MQFSDPSRKLEALGVSSGREIHFRLLDRRNRKVLTEIRMDIASLFIEETGPFFKEDFKKDVKKFARYFMLFFSIISVHYDLVNNFM